MRQSPVAQWTVNIWKQGVAVIQTKKKTFQLKETLSFLSSMKRLPKVSGGFQLTWARQHIRTMYV